MLYITPLSTYGDLLTKEEWLDGVASGLFTDDDGYGHLVKDGKMSSMYIYPTIADKRFDATHVLWFNR